MSNVPTIVSIRILTSGHIAEARFGLHRPGRRSPNNPGQEATRSAIERTTDSGGFAGDRPGKPGRSATMNSSHSRRAKPALLHRRSVLCGLVAPGAAAVPLRAARAQPSRSAQDPALGHPRLYFTQGELPRLRALRRRKSHARIWNNLIRAAEKCLAREPRRAWIPPVSPDPRYENLYDRFYAIMGDLAITEHLAFTAALSGERRFADAGRRWVLASCRAWRREADGAPDGGKAYAVTRLLKGAAVAYDLLYDEFTAAERAEVREVLAQIGDRYFTAYFQTPTIAGPEFSTHHAIVEWASFGVLALALLGEVPAARRWLEATTQKFQEHLLPRGLAKDGAHVEGSTFWASTLQYRLFFMDALRRVTGQDLFRRFEREMSADMALASVAAEHKASMWIEHGSVVLEPGYGQLDYYAPVLAALAREYNRPLLRRLALWDRTLG
ncbi:MAG: DUF4962 domain-containing protein, partial [Armatimonadetes bacterium]|nr:DUF4962 domain-containing protein [Armatimonadota bacterium]